jgi:predicted 2-oxoglutarate/Fe(II)-dependent dioxygenase YbiX
VSTSAPPAKLYPGDLAPWFRQRSNTPAGAYSFDMAAGRHVLLCFTGAAPTPRAAIEAHRHLFDSRSAICFTISADSAAQPIPGTIHIHDHDNAVSHLYGTVQQPLWFVLDPRLRILGIFPATGEGACAAFALFAHALTQPRDDAQIPVLTIPAVFEPAFCTRLIATYTAHGGQTSAVFTEAIPGASTTVTDTAAKRRRDLKLTDHALIDQIQMRIFRRVVPEIAHAFQFHATRLERLILACYDAADAGHFAPHRDNTVAATAHRRFAVSINLNEDFDGGGISFPEYGPRAFKPPPGGALVFSCSMMHAVSPMRRGRRYACLPFVYDDQAASLRRTITPNSL